MKHKKGVYAAFLLVSQLGLSMVVPILLCVFIGIKLDERFNTSLTAICIVVGVLAGIRNVFMLVSRTKNMIENENNQDE